MCKVLCSILVCAALILHVGCGHEELPTSPATSVPAISDPTIDVERAARSIVLASGWTFAPEVETSAGSSEQSRPNVVQGFDREVIVDDIVHYSFDLRIGPGPFDVIGLHRVVRERRPYHPIRTHDAVFLASGDVADFEANYLALAGTPADRALSVLLARADIDVWGMDFGWSRVPLETTDFSFMNGWGIPKDAAHLGTGIAIARLSRRFTGGGNVRLHLLGYSGGGQTGYAYLNGETVLPPGLRQVKGFIALESDPIATDDPEHQARTCVLAAGYQELLDTGVYQDEFGLVFATAGVLAEQAPDEPSPIVPGLDNYHAALFLGAATWNLLDYVPFLHFVGGVFEGGLPVDLRYSTVDNYLEFIRGLNPYFPVEVFRDRYATQCGEVDVLWDDHLAEITVPILAVGADGGIGDFSFYGAHATGSSDVTTLLVDLDADRSVDFGHVDVLAATDAPTLVWEPIRDWILAH